MPHLGAAREVEVRVDNDDLALSLFGTVRNSLRETVRNSSEPFRTESQTCLVLRARGAPCATNDVGLARDRRAQRRARPWTEVASRGTSYITSHRITSHHITFHSINATLEYVTLRSAAPSGLR